MFVARPGKRERRSLAGLVALLAAVNCTGSNVGPGETGILDASDDFDGGTPAVEDGGLGVAMGLPCAVTALITDRCRGCHGVVPSSGATISLVTRADFLARSPTIPEQTIGQRAAARVRAESAVMPPGTRLTDDETEPLVSWVSAGMPAVMCEDRPPPSEPFVALTRDAALLKVKTFLTGVAPSEAEYAAYRADPAALAGLVDGFMTLPTFRARALEMFRLLFQQRGDGDDLGAYLRLGNNARLRRIESLSGLPLRRWIQDSFAETVWEIVDGDRPFTETLTTRTYMLNVPLLALLAFRDGVRPMDDLGQLQTSWLSQRYPDLTVRFSRTATLTWAESVDPNSPSFGRFALRAAPDGNPERCNGALARTYGSLQGMNQIFNLMFGAPGDEDCWSSPSSLPSYFTDADRRFRPVTITLTDATDARTVFWDLDALRATRELRLGTEHRGFLGSFGFLGNWVTNDGNEYRGTANQSLIVALGRTVVVEDANVPQDGATVDRGHADPDSPCYGCHSSLDPLRDFFRQTYTYAGGPRRGESMGNDVIPEVAVLEVPGAAPVMGRGVGALAQAYADHPTFAAAWANKVCGLANVGMCSPSDPEIARITQAFVASGFRFKVLLRELLTSPLVTHQSATESSDRLGVEGGDAPRDDLCRRLTTRLGIHDACNLAGELDAEAGVARDLANYAGGVPEIAYARGAAEPSLVTAPSPFSSAGVERLCEEIATSLLDATGGGAPLFSASAREASIEVMVRRLMGLAPSDPRSGPIRDVLRAHWEEVVAGGEPADIALRSTFALACLSPLTTGLGL